MRPSTMRPRTLRPLPATAAPIAALATLAVCAGLAAAGPLSAQGLSPEQVITLRSVGSVAMSPDGRHVAYTVRQPRDEAASPGGSYSELWVVPAEGGEPRSLVSAPASASSPAWSPDGRWITFAARLDMHDQRQVYAVAPDGSGLRPLTSSPVGVGGYAWSPDGGRLAYTQRVPEPDEVAEGRARGDDVIVMSEQGSYQRLFVQPLDGRARAITPPDRVVRDFAWAPSGEWLALQVTAERTVDADYMYREIQAVAADGSWLRPLVTTEGKLGAMAFSPDGDALAWLGATEFNDPLAQSVFVAPVREGRATGTVTNVTVGLRASAVDVGWLDGRTVWYVVNEGTETGLYRVRADGSRREHVAGAGEAVFHGASWDARRRTFATSASAGTHPSEVYVGGGRGLRRVTDHNPWLDRVTLGEQVVVEWEGPEGWAIQGVVVKPVGFAEGRRYPLAILPHGGPEGVSQDGWTTNPLYPAQVLAAEGYVVLMPNYRGSGGYGVAFSKGDHRDLGGREMEDIIAGIDHLAELGWVDPERVGISGTSYGGFMSAWAATRWSHRFAVAIPFAGLTNWVSFTGTTDIPIEMTAVHFDLPIQGNLGIFMDRSPVANLEGADTPTLIGHGLADDRVHPEQSIQLYTLMKLHGIPVELVLYPREPHGLLEREHQLDYMGRILEWLGRYLKAGAPVS